MIKTIFKILLGIAICAGIFHTCRECSKDAKHLVLRGKFINEKQSPTWFDVYRGEKENNQQLWFSEEGHNCFILYFRIGKYYSIRFRRNDTIKWVFINAMENGNYNITIDMSDTKTVEI